MANGVDIAKAYVQIIPSADGISGKLSDIMDGEADKAGKSAGSKLSGAIGNVLKTAGKIGAAALGAAATGIGALTKSAIEGYAAYEQLVGGVETLFGAGGMSLQEYAQTVGKSTSLVEDEYGRMMTAQNTVLSNAAEAYKTAGLSQNEYMETVTSFSASLIGSLEGDTLAAAKAADLAIRDMSDNANKMGTDMGAIQNAYQGFAKQNYTMLDNLKLGYGGTKTEMERLLKDATTLSGVEYDIDNLADVYSAIHVIQDELGITGTTAKEASTTISGSIGMMQGAWANLVAGFGNGNADMEKLFGDLVSSAETVLGNLLPVAEQALGGIADAVGRLAPVIGERLPGIVSQVVPPLVAAAADLIVALNDALLANAPLILDAALTAAQTLAEGLLTPDNIAMLVDSAIEITLALADALVDALPLIIDATVTIITTLCERLTNPDTVARLLSAAWEIIKALASGIIKAIPQILTAAAQVLSNLFTALRQGLGRLGEIGRSLLQSVVNGIRGALGTALSIGRNIVEGIWNGISGALTWIKNKISGWVGNVMSFIKGLFGISSPSKWAEDMIGHNIGLGVGIGFVDSMGEVERMMKDAMPTFNDLLPNEIPLRPAASVSYGTRGTAALAPQYSYGGVTIQILGREKDADQLAVELQDALVRRTTPWD